ncbi:probable zinc transporter 10, partial [Tanacetum coccineum]
ISNVSRDMENGVEPDGTKKVTWHVHVSRDMDFVGKKGEVADIHTKQTKLDEYCGTFLALSQCEDETNNPCNNKSKALTLKVIGIGTILITSIIGVCLPLISRSVPALSPDRNLFVIVKAFASGIILATGFMHVLPDSFDMLRSSCLADNPWHKFPFTGFVAMLSAIFTLMVDSMATSMYTKKNNVIAAEGGDEVVARDQEIAVTGGSGMHFHGHHHGQKGAIGQQLLRYRVVAMVLELGIVVHSIVIGLGVGASNDVCTIKPLIAALCFHQMFEGMGLGGCILQAEYRTIKKTIMVFFFSTTTPFGIALGIGLSKVYKENSPTALITVGLLNASSAGLLIYMALVDLLAADFMGLKLQGSIKLQIKAYAAVLLGAGGMSLMAKWA